MIFSHVVQPALNAVKENWNVWSPRKIALIDWTLLNLLFLTVHSFYAGTFLFTPAYFKLWMLINTVWFVFSLFEHKFSLRHIHSFAELALKLFQITLLMLFAVSLTLVTLGLHNFNRFYILGTYGGLLLIELFVSGLYYPQLYPLMLDEAGQRRVRLRHPYALPIVALDFVLYFALFFLVHYVKYNQFMLELRHWQLLAIMTGIWVFSAKWTGKFEKRDHPSVYHAFEPFVKAAFVLIAAGAFLTYSFQLFNFSRAVLFIPVALLLAFEAPAVLIWFRVNSVEKPHTHGDIENTKQMRRFLKGAAQEWAAIAPDEVSVYRRLQVHYLADRPALLGFIASHCELDKIALRSLTVLDTDNAFNIEVLENKSLQMFINLHRVNDFRHINHYFLEVHRKLLAGGYFIGLMDAADAMLVRLRKKYPKYMALSLYSLDFLFRRVMPKLPGLNKLYFMISRGRRRVFAKAELLGRLHFCGFHVLGVEHAGSQLFFVAQKNSLPDQIHEPSYGMLIRLQRIGFQGRPFYLYKLRTMHPYSEFVQDYIYRHHQLDEGGKFRDDFRVAEWGKLLRKLWLDELPQLINWLRGDLKLVGARALSDHYFSLYPKDLQALRIQFKPGLIPPYYADMPRTLTEIQDSERRYFAAKLQHPIWTDWKYFFLVFYNIVVKRARSK
jgi:lipopolysaccharide/colanic/teichoic acid biosynthesis glycosyltransferase